MKQRIAKSNYELFNRNNFNIRYWSWNYRGCWHQTFPPVEFNQDFTLNSFRLQDKIALYRYFMSLPPFVRIGQFTRLLPSLDVVAVSQAPSPESDPNPPLAIEASVGQYPTDKANSSETWLIHRIKFDP